MSKNYLKYLASLLLFGSNGIVVSAMNLPSHEIALLRTLLGGALLVAMFLSSGKRFTLHKDIKNLLLIAGSGCALGVSWIFVYLAYQEVGVAVTSLLYALGPVGLVALSPVLFGGRITAKTVAGLAVVLLGVFLVNGVASSSLSIAGIGWGLLAACCYTVMVALSKKACASDGLERSAVQLVSAFVAVVVAIAILGMPLVVPSQSDIAPVLVLGLVNTGVACYLYFSVVADLPSSTVAACSYLEPLSAVVLSAAVLQEPLGISQWVGALLIVTGAILCELRVPRRRVRIAQAATEAAR